MIDSSSLRVAMGPGARLHHIGFAVQDLETLAPDLLHWHDPVQRVTVAFAALADVCIEFVQPAAGDSPVSAALGRGQHLLHLCFEVPELSSAIVAARRHGFSLLHPPTPAAAFDGRKIAWIFSRVLGLVELLEAAGPQQE
jgi:methylmalonyl-CoA/ethylmalonyl-CoA epimerase